jgi:hypothetical protein
MDWRSLLAEWAKQVIGGRDVAMPAMEKPIADVVRRAGLSVDGGRALMLVYGAWVMGEPRVSLAVATRTVAWGEVRPFSMALKSSGVISPRKLSIRACAIDASTSYRTSLSSSA